MKQIFLDKNGHHNSPSSVFERVLNQNISGCFNTTGHLTCVLNISSGLSFSSASYLPLNNVLCLRRVHQLYQMRFHRYQSKISGDKTSNLSSGTKKPRFWHDLSPKRAVLLV